jgi:formate-dependent nitrite reductase membrane component NrfD
VSDERDMTPAVGSRGEPASWQRADNVGVPLARPGFGDARDSFLYGDDTRYAGAAPAPAEIAAANRRMRDGGLPDDLRGPFLKPPVWTWEVPLYFWFGGIASGSAFVALAADLAGDERSAAVARKLALAAVLPAPPLLIADLGRPARFLNMLRILKPRSPMNLGAWCLAAFSATTAAAVAADELGLRRTARTLGAANAVLGGYLGSYTGVLLATTAVPVWSRSRVLLGPVFVSTAAATGSAATRLALTAAGLPARHPTRVALSRLETGAILAELTLSSVNQRRLGRAGEVLSNGTAGRLFATAKRLVGAGLVLGLLERRLGSRSRDAAGVLYLAAGLAFRFAWVAAGKASARDDEAVALTARAARPARALSAPPRPPRGPAGAARVWSRTVGRMSLAVERLLRDP